MNDRNTGGMTISSLLFTGLIVSVAIPVALIIVLGILAHSSSPVFVYVDALCAVGVLLGVLVVNYFIKRKIQDRLLALIDICRSYAGGDRTVRATVTGDDEFAMLAMSLNTLLDSQGFVSGAVASGGSGSDAAALQAQIEKLLQEVSAVGDGDLRVQAEVTPDTLGVLADSFNYMTEQLSGVVGQVQSMTMQVTTATRRILDRSADLAQAAQQQEAQIAQATEAVESLASFIQNTARNAQLSAEAAQEALRNARGGEQAVVQTIEGMVHIRENVQETAKKIKRLGERSQEIGEIVRIIEDIADQTNLLALNAAIQSAMAGEHGRGFSVVADEIRTLAERSSASTKRIATIVKSIQGDTYDAVVAMEESTQDVVAGSRLADEAGRALKSIYAAVDRQAQMIEAIARSANERVQTSEAVAIAMNQILEITRQTTSVSQDTAQNVNYLSDLADQLRASVATFRLPEKQAEDVLAEPPGGSPPLLNMPGMEQFDTSTWLLPGEEQGLTALPARAGGSSVLPGPDQGLSLFNGQQTFSNQAYNGQQGYNANPQQGYNAGGQRGYTPAEQGYNPQQGPGFSDQSFGNRPFTNQPPYE